MGQLYYAQTQLYSTVLGVKFSGQYGLNIAIHYSLRGVHLVFRFFSQILSQGPNQLIYTRGWRGYYARRRCTASLRSVAGTPRPSTEQDRQNIPEEQDYKPTGY